MNTIRNSKQREMILQLVRNTNSHPTADWVYDQARKSNPKISLGTVYRNLNQLVRLNIINAIKDDSVLRYDGNLHHHDHFKCKTCGKVFDMEILDQGFIRTANLMEGFDAHDFTLEIRGICANCNSN